ncbi:MAG: hypothetical protein C0504_08320 [Candidatus Solibacter sp.]|nr:hypothetical protein [Candidatus Solibacter sp.]
MHPDLERVLEVQGLDLRIVALRTEIATLPKQVAAIEKLLDEHFRKLELDKMVLAGNLKDRKKHEIDIQGHEQKIAKLKDQMMQARTNEQLWAFQKEIGFFEAEIGKLEDRILALMMDAEQMEGKVKASQAALDEERRTVEARKADATRRCSVDKKELSEVLGKRKELAGAIPAALLATYDKLHAKMRDGVAIAGVEDGICQACRMMVRPQLNAELRMGQQILACENCRRLLYYTAPPVDVEGQMNV